MRQGKIENLNKLWYIRVGTALTKVNVKSIVLLTCKV